MAGQFVFIDARVSDVDTLLGGLVPGAQVRLLDPARDGLAQIAQALREADAGGLTAISIVAHGAPGRLEIGPDGLDIAGLPARTASLSDLAAALGDDGVLHLYACETGREPGGRDFVAALSAALGGVAVCAATGRLGEGRSWQLDIATTAAPAAVPFATSALAVYPGVLAIRFQNGSSTTFPAVVTPGRHVVGDFDGDGDADILSQTAGDGSAFQYSQSNGNGTYATAVPQGSSPFSAVTLVNNSATNYRVGDFNGDGKADIFAGTANSDGTVYLSNVSGTFTQVDTTGLTTMVTPGRTAVGDFDGDGRADILYQTAGDGSAFRFGRGDGDGTFTDVDQASSPFSAVTLVNNSATNYRVGDFNGDGKADIFAGTANSDGTVYLSNANGTFTQVDTTGLMTITTPGRTVIGDFDSDGRADILYQTVGDGSAFRFGKGNGNGTFTDVDQASSPFAGITLANHSATNYFIGDVDGDRDLDV